MRQHSALNRGIMFEWLRDLDDTGDRCPSDDAIMERFDFDTPEQARTLIADLADRGLISVRYVSGERVITIGKTPAPAASAERPIPSVVKANASVERGTRRIMDIIHGGKKAPSPKLAPEKPPVSRPPKEEEKRPRQVNFRTTEARYQILRDRALAEQSSISEVASAIFAEAMREPSAPAPAAPPQERKPILRADMTAAAIRNGFPIDSFVRLLLERGFQSFCADEQAEIAA